MVEGLDFPAFGGVACVALRRGGNVLRIFAVGVDIIVAACAIFWRAFKHAAAMAGFALRIRMRAKQRKAGGEMVKGLGRLRHRRIHCKHAAKQRKYYQKRAQTAAQMPLISSLATTVAGWEQKAKGPALRGNCKLLSHSRRRRLDSPPWGQEIFSY